APVVEEDTVPGTAVTSSLPPASTPPAAEKSAPVNEPLDMETNDLLSLLLGGEGTMEETVDAEAFWCATFTDVEAENSRGISLAEALQRGLIDFNQDDEPKA